MNVRNIGGRPKIETSKKKKNRLVCYINDEEYLLLEKRLNTTREKVAELLKNALIKELSSDYKEPRKFTKKEIDILNDISRLGNVLNQVARKLNSGVKLSGFDSIEVISSINELQNNLIELKQSI